MSIDKFGRSIYFDYNKSSSIPPTPVPLTFGYSLTKDGHIDIENKRICNLSKPANPADASNKLYVDDKLMSVRNEMRQRFVQLKTTLNDIQQELDRLRTSFHKVENIAVDTPQNVTAARLPLKPLITTATETIT